MDAFTPGEMEKSVIFNGKLYFLGLTPQTLVKNIALKTSNLQDLLFAR